MQRNTYDLDNNSKKYDSDYYRHVNLICGHYVFPYTINGVKVSICEWVAVAGAFKIQQNSLCTMS